YVFFFFQAEDGIRDWSVTGVQTCALPIFQPRGLVITRNAQRLVQLLAIGKAPAAVGLPEVGRVGQAGLGVLGLGFGNGGEQLLRSGERRGGEGGRGGGGGSDVRRRG